MSAKQSFLYLSVLLALFIVGCSRAAPTPTPTATAVPTATPAVSPTPTTTPTPKAESVIYVVQEGDTLSGIAERFETTLEAIIEANNIPDPDFLRAGDELVIPRE